VWPQGLLLQGSLRPQFDQDLFELYDITTHHGFSKPVQGNSEAIASISLCTGPVQSELHQVPAHSPPDLLDHGCFREGGADALDELFETLTHIQTGRVKDFPILLYGKDYWKPMLEQIDHMIAEGSIGRTELKFVFVADSVDEATELLQDQLVEMWQEAHDRKDAPKWWFLEDQPNAPGVVR
jgi:hypothetical protein